VVFEKHAVRIGIPPNTAKTLFLPFPAIVFVKLGQVSPILFGVAFFHCQQLRQCHRGLDHQFFHFDIRDPRKLRFFQKLRIFPGVQFLDITVAKCEQVRALASSLMVSGRSMMLGYYRGIEILTMCRATRKKFINRDGEILIHKLRSQFCEAFIEILAQRQQVPNGKITGVVYHQDCILQFLIGCLFVKFSRFRVDDINLGKN
jgi:hypothetical protein